MECSFGEFPSVDLARLGRAHPDLDATSLFTDEEWKGAYLHAKKPFPKTPPTVREIIR